MTREEAIKWLEYHKQGEIGKAVEALDMAIKALEQEPKISLEVYKQVTKERDIAIEQLHELGYEFGEKIPTTQERQAESDRFDAAFQDGYNNGYAQAKFDYEQEPTTKNDLGVDCISRAYLYNRIKGIDHDEDYECDEYGGSRITYHTCDWDEVLREIENAPSVTPQESKTGHWITSDDGLYRPICDKCGAHPWKGYIPTVEEATEVFKYCPNCGCAMVEPQESEGEALEDEETD